jgi:hypothetical protein
VSTSDRLPTLTWVVDAEGEQLQRYVASAHPGLRRSAARNKRLTPEQIATLAADEDFPVRLLLCENQETVPTDLVVRTYLEARVITRGRLLSHPAIVDADLTGYADSLHWGARALVVRDRRAPAELIDRLSRDEHPGVRNWAAPDPRLSRNGCGSCSTTRRPPRPPPTRTCRSRSCGISSRRRPPHLRNAS